MTSGRHSATASATAAEPSICLSMGCLLLGVFNSGANALECFGGGGDVALRDFAGEFCFDGLAYGFELDLAGECGETGQQRNIGDRTANVLEAEVGGGKGT